jgi:Zn-dependent peptidase ImmA (M78 family)
MKEIGLSNPNQIPIELIASGLGATMIVKKLPHADGRIVFGEKRVIITINEDIEYEGKRRFTIAHEIGHLVMHRKHFQAHQDNDATLEYFQKGNQETEANEFASELLMPEALFRKESDEYEFSPALLGHLAEYFNTSLTSIAYNYFKYGIHPICLIYSYKNVVKYWMRPAQYQHFLKDMTRLPLPADSVGAEYFIAGKINERFVKQQIWKSTWFELKSWERDEDFKFYEYCIITPKHQTVLSIVWEE